MSSNVPTALRFRLAIAESWRKTSSVSSVGRCGFFFFLATHRSIDWKGNLDRRCHIASSVSHSARQNLSLLPLSFELDRVWREGRGFCPRALLIRLGEVRVLLFTAEPSRGTGPAISQGHRSQPSGEKFVAQR